MSAKKVHLLYTGVHTLGWQQVNTEKHGAFLFCNGEAWFDEPIAKVLIDEGFAKRAPDAPPLIIDEGAHATPKKP